MNPGKEALLALPFAKLNVTGQGGLIVNRDAASGLADVIVSDVNVTCSGGLTINV